MFDQLSVVVVAVGDGKGGYRDGCVESVSSVDADKGVVRRERLDLSVSIGEALVERCQNFIFGFQIADLLGGRWWRRSGQLAVKVIVGTGDVRQLAGKGANRSVPGRAASSQRFPPWARNCTFPAASLAPQPAPGFRVGSA